MSKQFYNYLSNKLINYFKENLMEGDKFYLQFDEDEQVRTFYQVLKDFAHDSGEIDEKDFTYKHEFGEEFKTYSLLINDKKVVVANSLDVTSSYMVTLRNQVINPTGVWKNAALLVICHNAIDSIYNGMRDLQKSGMPFNVNSISKNLINEIEDSSLSKKDKEITKFYLGKKEEDLFQTTIWDYEEILSILNKGYVDVKEEINLGLFPDPNLKDLNRPAIQKRLRENFDIHEEIEQFKEYGKVKSKLENKFDNKGVAILNSDDWKETKFNVVLDSKNNFSINNKPLIYSENLNKFTHEGLVYWEKPKSHTKAGGRTRYFLIFNDKKLNNVSLDFEFNHKVSKKYLKSGSDDFVKTNGKKLKMKFSLNNDEITFKKIVYQHNNDNKSKFSFFILVIPAEEKIFKSIKSRYSIKSKGKKLDNIVLTGEEFNEKISFGYGNSVEELEINDENQDVFLPLTEVSKKKIFISENSSAWEKSSLTFNLYVDNVKIPFMIKEESKRQFPVKSVILWKNKRENHEDIIFNGIKALQGVNSLYIEDSFKEYLNMEQEIIDNDIFCGFKHVGGNIEKVNISLNNDLKEAYQNIFNYYKTKNNVPSLVYLNDELKLLYETFIDLFNKEIESIPENSILSSDLSKLDLLKLGLLKDGNHILFSSLSPLNIAYQLEVNNQCGNEILEKNILERLIPNNLVPYIFGENDVLYRPVYQTDAHEWAVYEKSEKVAIGTTNAFIANVVSEKINQFISHFDYLFDLNNTAPIKLNIINITDDKEVVKGIFNFMKNRLLSNLNENIIPIELNIYSDAENSSLDNFFECNTKEQIDAYYGIKLKSNKIDELEIIRLIQDNIVYYKHASDVENYEYAHISFYKSCSNGNIADDNMDQIETGLSLNGLLSSITSINNNSDYRVGFGTKNILDKSNSLVKTSINLNELCKNNVNKGDNTYSKGKTIITKPDALNENVMTNLYRKSHWVTFIEPNFGIEYFENLADLIIIHYSDQYTSSTQYDTITVTNRSKQYENIIKKFLKDHNLDISEDKLIDLIKMFNSINGEWLLRTINNPGNYEREKLSIISAIKYALAILDHPDIIWIPISMEEILRIAGNIKLDKNEGIFSIKSLNEKGVHSDDLLFIGVRKLKDGDVVVYYHPIEVKIGYNFSSTIKKGKTQLDNTYNLIKEQLNQTNVNHTFRNKFFRNFFVQILLSNEQKLSVNHVWDNKSFDKIRKLKSKLLNDDYSISYDLEPIIGIGSLISFKKDNYFMSVNLEDNKQIIELTDEYARSGLIESVDEIHDRVQSDGTDILKSNLLSSCDLDNLEKISYSEESNGSRGNEILSNSDELDGGNEDISEFNNEDNEINGSVGTSDICHDSENDLEDIVPIKNTDSNINKNNLEDVRAYIGKANNSNHKIFWEFGNPSLANRHMLIQGKSGQGKTYFIQRMIKEMSEQGIPSIIIDYTDGFKKSKLENNFKSALNSENKIQEHVVVINKFPLNPFKKNLIEIDEDYFIPEDNSSVASRFKSTISSVYTLGSQQLNVIYQAVINGLEKYDSNMNLTKLKEELILNDSSSADTVLSQLNELLDKNPFISEDEFDWSILENHEGKVIIIQLTGLSRDIQKIVSELILWDLWNYKTQKGSEDNPFVMVLDEAHNLDFDSKSPCGKILTEGRKFGWSGWFATQSLKGSMQSDEISRFENADEKIFFHPTDDSVNYIAGTFTNNNSDKKDWKQKLLKLKKGQCVVYGSILNDAKELVSSNPVCVNIEPIDKKFDTKFNKTFKDENGSLIQDSSNLKLNTKHICHTGKYYRISKSINGKNKYFGYYKTLEDAVKVRDELESNNWDKTKVNIDFNYERKSKYGKYISKVSKYFTINKLINGNLKNFGYYNSLEEATEARDYFIDNGWDYDHIPKELSKKNRNIHKSNHGYTIYKRINGELKCFGEFETLDDAIEVRNELELNNWGENNNFDSNSEEKYDEYVFYKNGMYYIKHEIEGVLNIFGVFDDPLDAIDARNMCIKKNWNLNSIDETKFFENSDFSFDV